MINKRSPGAPASAAGTRLNSDGSRYRALGARGQEAAETIGFGDKPAMPGLVLRSFRPVLKDKLCGFASVELPCGVVLIELPVFLGRDGPWAALPRKAVLDRERRQKLDINGQPTFQAIAEWRNRQLADRFSAAVVRLIAAAHPGAFDWAAQ